MKLRSTMALLALAGAGFIGKAATRGVRLDYTETGGQALYEHICQGCHMADAKGAIGAGAYPSLRDDIRLRSALYPALVVVRGQKAMPAFDDLTDAQVAEVVNYLRSHFGNAYGDPLRPEQVTGLRRNQGGPTSFQPG